MKIFVWNVRGLNNSDRQRDVRRWMQLNNVSVGALVETHIQEENLAYAVTGAFPGWRFDSNVCQAQGGRIIVLWNPTLSLVVLTRSEQLLLCSVFDPETGISVSLAFVYAYNTVTQRRTLWQEIIEISNHRLVKDSSLLVLGDFNQILSAAEHYSIQSYPLPVQGILEFQDCLLETDLTDVEGRGGFYTWSNQRPEDPILRKLDRVLGNAKWRATFPDIVASYQAQGDSDHSPCTVELVPNNDRRNARFIYYSFLASHPKFLESI